MIKLVLSGSGAASEHDGMCMRSCLWEEQLWEQQEQLEREMVEARRMVSSLQVTCWAGIDYLKLAAICLRIIRHAFSGFFSLRPNVKIIFTIQNWGGYSKVTCIPYF